MPLYLIFVIATLVAFAATGVAGGRAGFHEKLAKQYLRDTDNLDPEGTNYRHFLDLARRAEAAGSRWDSTGVVGIFTTIVLAMVAFFAAFA